MELRIERVTGARLQTMLPELARLRMQVFRAFPYLYDGDLEYEADYLQTYVDAPDSLFLIALAENQIVGASTALPLTAETAEVREPFEKAGFDLTKIIYFGESVLEPAYRGRGIGVQFFAEREAYAQQWQPLHYTCFCAVDRPPDHPRRPTDYQPLDSFWIKRGYYKEPSLTTTFTWKDLDEPTPTPKPMTFWLKKWPTQGVI